MIIDQCPHCKTRHVQTQHMAGASFSSNSSDPHWKIERCQNQACGGLILIQIQGGIIRDQYPAATYDLDPELNVPEQIREDYKEAGDCLGVGCCKASMVMSRRALQILLREQGCKKKKLVDAIDEAIKNDLLRTKLHPIATEIRQYGNLGAHPDDDQLKNANPENAKQLLEFVELLIEEFYQIPAAATRLRKNRESLPNKNGANPKAGSV